MPLGEGNDTLSALCRYQLLEDPLLLPGHTFSPDPDSPRRWLERWPDAGSPAGHPCHNPFGRWRLLERSSRQPPASPIPTFVPPLVTLLLAAERKAGRPLVREEVERIRDAATTVALEPRHAQALERSRGYADLDPQLAWEQWELSRRALD